MRLWYALWRILFSVFHVMRFFLIVFVVLGSATFAQIALHIDVEEDRDTIRDLSIQGFESDTIDGLFDQRSPADVSPDVATTPFSLVPPMPSVSAGVPNSAAPLSSTRGVARGLARARPGGGEASRIFAGPRMYPPEHFAAYGIIAFKSRPLASDRARFFNICMGYVAALLTPQELDIPLDRQLVTVWPVDQDAVAERIMTEADRSFGCQLAVDDYGLAASLSAINDARMALGEEHRDILTRNKGPFLLAWSPSRTKGTGDALIFGMDLSNVETADLARNKFVAWRDDIEAHQDRWIGGWKKEGLADVIGSWADRWGETIVAFVNLGKDDDG